MKSFFTLKESLVDILKLDEFIDILKYFEPENKLFGGEIYKIMEIFYKKYYIFDLKVTVMGYNILTNSDTELPNFKPRITLRDILLLMIEHNYIECVNIGEFPHSYKMYKIIQ